MCLCLHLRKISRFCQLLCILSSNNVDLHVFELWNIVASSIKLLFLYFEDGRSKLCSVVLSGTGDTTQSNIVQGWPNP